MNFYQNLKMLVCTTLTLFVVGENHSQSKKNKKPNILFCIADDASMKSFGTYGDTFINTPAIDKLAKEGLTFNNAYNCNPKCAPARACLVTGKYSWQLKAATNHWPNFPEEFKFYPHLLMEKGYNVGFTGKGWGPGQYTGKYNPAGPEYSDIKLTPPHKGISNIDYAANFEKFLKDKGTDAPFCFWFGTKEPHRFYELDSWKKEGKKLVDAKVPPFYPDNVTVRGDILDYAVEVEWFDTHIGKAIKSLEKRGLLENTLVVISSDHGMPFPRVKGQIYEEGFHVPLIAYWKGKIQAGRTVEDFVNFPDIAPTFMEVAGYKPHKQMTGKSFKDILFSKKSGQVDASRDHVLLGKERHDIGRANEDGVNLSYPVRAIRNQDFLYVHNIKPERWPAGNPEYGFRNVDNSPTKTFLMNIKPESSDYRFYTLSFGLRAEEELYDMKNDPHCMVNLAQSPIYKELCKKMRAEMEKELTAQGDPRTLGNGDIFDKYPYTGRQFDYLTGKSVGFKKKIKH
ncbi:arylsulfatase A-like enzyme [Wenyingzhuangia heitensis]|uniref:Arylsulfatase A-like enzyme n=1 Tax=Wenyingzhuangia heitensis TaxID=1487859 RepID=A0ABX0U7L9_9FLAO|nr:sulfatase [Wenyingzhuangia heitensis]NIJ44848.1 arylsulfatase A-like enzyme [Wenyingzhuangia heitensis]